AIWSGLFHVRTTAGSGMMCRKRSWWYETVSNIGIPTFLALKIIVLHGSMFDSTMAFRDTWKPRFVSFP
ncbi:hypothetical protein, partial [Kushneria phosphatilytica]|uniref:hypothetical protein n=1 Tax=Kushneria phosphatilytica TaxID=657387 RepID=UPI00197EC711